MERWQKGDAGRFILEIETRLQIVPAGGQMIFVKAAIIVDRRIGGVDPAQLERRTGSARPTGEKVDRIILGVDFIVNAFGPQIERAVGAGNIGGDPQRARIPASADRKLIGICVTLGRALKTPGVVAAAAGRGLVDSSADDLVAVEHDVLVRGAAPQRLGPHPVGCPFAISLPQPFGVKFKIGRRPPLDRAVDRRTPSFGFAILDFGPVGRARTGKIGDEEAVTPR